MRSTRRDSVVAVLARKQDDVWLGGPLWSPVGGGYFMAEGAIKSDIEDHQKASQNIQSSEKTTSEEKNQQVESIVSRAKIIWTPRFIVIFALILVFGLSIESLLAQGWLNGYYTGLWIFQIHIMLVCSGWIALLLLAHSNGFASEAYLESSGHF